MLKPVKVDSETTYYIDPNKIDYLAPSRQKYIDENDEKFTGTVAVINGCEKLISIRIDDLISQLGVDIDDKEESPD